MVKSIAEQISRWSKDVFPDLTLEKQLLKLEEELNEEKQAQTPEDLIGERADVYIVASILWKRFNSTIGQDYCDMYDFQYIKEAARKKLEINKKRVWMKTKEGMYHHV